MTTENGIKYYDMINQKNYDGLMQRSKELRDLQVAEKFPELLETVKKLEKRVADLEFQLDNEHRLRRIEEAMCWKDKP